MRTLRDQMLIDLQLSEAKPRTQDTYLWEMENLIKYFNRSPEEWGEVDLKQYMLHMISERHLYEGTFRLYVAGLKFFDRTTLKREWPVEKIRCPRSKRKLPVMLDLSEVESIFSVTRNLKHKAILMMTYSAGLRARKTARLKLTDIDSKRMTVKVSDGKGGKGADLNGRKLTVSSVRNISRSLLATGFPYDIRESKENNLDYFNVMAVNVQAIRRAGAAALDLAYLAAGRFDGFWELKLKPWDTAAGCLMVEESGGRVSDLFGGKWNISSSSLLASNALIHKKMIDIFRQK